MDGLTYTVPADALMALVEAWNSDADRYRAQAETLREERERDWGIAEQSNFEAELKERARVLRYSAGKLHSEIMRAKLAALKARSEEIKARMGKIDD